MWWGRGRLTARSDRDVDGRAAYDVGVMGQRARKALIVRIHFANIAQGSSADAGFEICTTGRRSRLCRSLASSWRPAQDERIAATRSPEISRRSAMDSHPAGHPLPRDFYYVSGSSSRPSLIDEYAGQHRSRCAWICVCRLQWCTGRMWRCALLKSADTDRSRWKNCAAPRPDEARRLATGDVGPMSVVRHRSRESNRSRVTE